MAISEVVCGRFLVDASAGEDLGLLLGEHVDADVCSEGANKVARIVWNATEAVEAAIRVRACGKGPQRKKSRGEEEETKRK